MKIGFIEQTLKTKNPLLNWIKKFLNKTKILCEVYENNEFGFKREPLLIQVHEWKLARKCVSSPRTFQHPKKQSSLKLWLKKKRGKKRKRKSRESESNDPRQAASEGGKKSEKKINSLFLSSINLRRGWAN